MTSDSGERRQAARVHIHGVTHPPEPEHLPCPRCDSSNTKFCYYNNYNLSQPRHFCKSCRRYWTRGGTLRNVPVGGGTRKNPNKRLRTADGYAAITPQPSSLSASSTLTHDPIPANPITIMSGVNLNEDVPEPESFASFLNPVGSALFSSGRFSGYGFHEMGYGLGAGLWQVEEVGDGSGAVAGGCNTWQVGHVERGGDGDCCFGWPDLAISTPAKGLN